MLEFPLVKELQREERDGEKERKREIIVERCWDVKDESTVRREFNRANYLKRTASSLYSQKKRKES